MIGFPKSLMSLSFLLTLLQISHVLSISNGGSEVNYTTVIAQALEAGISIERAKRVAEALEFERSNWATGSVETDEFYSNVPRNASNAPAGSLLKVQVLTSTPQHTRSHLTRPSRESCSCRKRSTGPRSLLQRMCSGLMRQGYKRMGMQSLDGHIAGLGLLATVVPPIYEI